MATFRYTAISASGERIEGILVGDSEQAVLAELDSRQLTPVAVSPAAGGSDQSSGRLPARQLGESYGQLADLLRAGVPLLRGLRLLGGRRSRPRVSRVFASLAQEVEKGSDLAAAMERRSDSFPTLHIAMVRAGERGGFLESVLAQLGGLVIKQAELTGKILGNMIYPAVLVVFGLGIAAVIFGVFVPQFRPMFARIEGGLPLVTTIVFIVSDAITKYGLVSAALIGAAGAGIAAAMRRPDVKARIDQARLRLPVLGPIQRGVATARLCRLLGSMLANGVPMLAALRISRDAVGNPVMQRAIDAAAEAVQSGAALAPPLEASGLFDDDIVEMIRVGESANNLSEVLLTIADTIEARLDRLLNVAIRLIEPLLLVLIAGLVGLVAAGLLLPLTKLSQAV
ncbi:MAG: type II secretion system F family protein [Phycisphaerales bacterium]